MPREPGEQAPAWESALYWGSWAFLWVFAAIVILMCIFGCLVYYW